MRKTGRHDMSSNTIFGGTVLCDPVLRDLMALEECEELGHWEVTHEMLYSRQYQAYLFRFSASENGESFMTPQELEHAKNEINGKASRGKVNVAVRRKQKEKERAASMVDISGLQIVRRAARKGHGLKISRSFTQLVQTINNKRSA